MNGMRPKHQRTLDAILEDPVRSNIAWRDIQGDCAILGNLA